MTISDIARKECSEVMAGLLAGGTLEIRTGRTPKNVEEAGTVLAVLSLGYFQRNSDGEVVAESIAPENRARASGDMGHYLAKSVNGDMICVGSAGEGNQELQFDSKSVIEGGMVALRSFAIVMPAK